jgi:hypothetical protein
LKRIDADKVRQSIHERIFTRFWNGFRTLLPTVVSVTAVVLAVMLRSQMLVQVVHLGTLGLTGVTFPLAIGLTAAVKYLKTRSDVHKEPATVSLNEILDLPDYGKELGFVHHVEADLRRVFDAVPETYFPIVVFIDDLDRCSPTKVGQVVEAVNLFLAGDFPRCIFILGMDTEMVAAALQAAHKDMIEQLPADAGIPVGWKFMDKFVQLPFLIPPADGSGFLRYTQALFTNGANSPALVQRDAGAVANESGLPINAGDNPSATPTQAGQHASPAGKPATTHDKKELEKRIVTEIDKFSDSNPEIRRLISTGSVHFRGNPRELKRFVNVFRLHYFLWAVRRSQRLEVPTLSQVVRWTVFSVRWPEVVRWLRRGGKGDWDMDGQHSNAAGILIDRMKLIEEITIDSTNPAAWKSNVQKRLQLQTTQLPEWLNDDDLFLFLHAREDEMGESILLSEGVGKGLW